MDKNFYSRCLYIGYVNFTSLSDDSSYSTHNKINGCIMILRFFEIPCGETDKTKVGDEIIWLECPAEKKDETQIRAETSSVVGIQEKQTKQIYSRQLRPRCKSISSSSYYISFPSFRKFFRMVNLEVINDLWLQIDKLHLSCLQTEESPQRIEQKRKLKGEFANVK